MGLYRNELPQLTNKNFISDGGLETSLVFHEGVDLPHFASFPLLKDAAGRQQLSDYFKRYAALAVEHKAGLIVESVTWRAHSDWGSKLGYDRGQLREANIQAVDELVKLRDEFQTPDSPIVVSGNIGPRGDGYSPDQLMSAEEARRYHGEQVATLAESRADMICAMTINYIAEAIGIVHAARDHDMPVCISFTVETDGRLPTGESLKEAIQTVDAETDGYAAYFMINCAHPTHFQSALEQGAAWTDRIYAMRCNASTLSHAELDECEELDIGDPEALGHEYAELKKVLKNLHIFGGCCGTDHRHVAQICKSCL